MKQIEQNVMNSFRLAKTDIIKLQKGFLDISQTQERIVEMLDTLKSHERELYQKVKEMGVSMARKPTPKTIIKTITKKPKTIVKTVTKTVTKRPKKVFVASKVGSKFHIAKCPFAQNIKPKSKLTFKLKNTALNNGFKPCKCVK